MVLEDVAPRVEGWPFLENYTGSDHLYLAFKIPASRCRVLVKPLTTPRWNLDKLDAKKFYTALR